MTDPRPDDTTAEAGGVRGNDQQHGRQPIRVNTATEARERCWRVDCRDAFGEYRTIAFLRDGRIVAFCHGRILDDLAYRTDVWKYGQVAA